MKPNLVRETATALSRQLGLEADGLAKVLGFWVRKTPRSEHEDVLQLASLKLLEDRPATMGLAFAGVKGTICDWWDSYKLRGAIPLQPADPESADIGAIAAVAEWELRSWEDERACWMDVQSVMRTATGIQRGAIERRLLGKRLCRAEEAALEILAVKLREIGALT